MSRKNKVSKYTYIYIYMKIQCDYAMLTVANGQFTQVQGSFAHIHVASKLYTIVEGGLKKGGKNLYARI